MANTIIVANLLQKEIIRYLDKNRVMTPWANRKYEKDLKEQGDTVTVQTFPDLDPHRGGTAGSDITDQDWAITSENLTVKELVRDSRIIKDNEEVRSNLKIRSKISNRYAYALSQVHERHVGITAALGAYADNKLYDGAPVTLTKATVYAAIEEMMVALEDQNAGENPALFADPKTISYIKQSGMLDGFVEGYNQRKTKGLKGEISGFTLYKTTNLPCKIDLQMATNPSDGDTITVNITNLAKVTTAMVITFKTSAVAAGQCDIGANIAATQANLVKMINGSGVGDGTDYFEFSTAQRALLTKVEAFAGAFASDAMPLTLNNKVTVAETFTDATDTWGTVGLVMIAMDMEALNFVDQFTKFKINPPTSNDGFYAKMQYESVFQAKVFEGNDRRIATYEIAA